MNIIEKVNIIEGSYLLKVIKKDPLNCGEEGDVSLKMLWFGQDIIIVI
jgi:hypothetical protein